MICKHAIICWITNQLDMRGGGGFYWKVLSGPACGTDIYGVGEGGRDLYRKFREAVTRAWRSKRIRHYRVILCEPVETRFGLRG